MFKWISDMFTSPVVECPLCGGVGWKQSGRATLVAGSWPPRMVYPVRRCLACDGTGRVEKDND